MRTSSAWFAAVFATGCSGSGTNGGDASLGADTPRAIAVSISGEALASTGYDYTAMPGSSGDPVFVDGWEIRFERYLVVVDHVKLNAAGSDPTMRTAVGALVAHRDGPWVVDVHRPGPITGAGGAPETAIPLFTFAGPDPGGRFDPTVRYAFSFDEVSATPNAIDVNLDASGTADLQTMVAHGWSEYFTGTATYRGRAASATVDPTFVSYPRTVVFAFGFGAPATYANCHNPSLGEDDVPANRGIQVSTTGGARAQITLHTDHFFWDQANVEGTPLHFDELAARAQGFGTDPSASHALTLADLAGVNVAALTDRNNLPVLDRGAQTSGYTHTGALAFQLNGATGVTDLRDFVVYNARGHGHLNSDGLCAVVPNGPFAY